MATRREIVARVRRAVAPLYEPQEADAVAREAVCRLTGVNFSQLVTGYDEECDVAGLDSAVARLAAGCPVQYVTGVAEFCDMDFEVCEGVLIPRLETEDLVLLIERNVPRGAHILDVGTGSGAIAVSLAARLEGARVEALDISTTALEVARRNCLKNGVEVSLHRGDALADFSALGEFDAIVSNPPYVPQSDLDTMPRNVRDYEPHTALFVPDDDALCFYRSIAKCALKMLCEGGSLFFEIYEHYGEQTCAMLRAMGFKDVQLLHDRFDKPRMIWSRR
ncbi:MAG: peptide chain release factor N(5)-glutamine methyltransferase [Alistipes sp.]|nr:peptide chain release factor N(5)-glutamine methyltransferase [Alistipes sp.]